jgi:hypothetical protein
VPKKDQAQKPEDCKYRESPKNVRPSPRIGRTRSWLSPLELSEQEHISASKAQTTGNKERHQRRAIRK